MGTKVQKKYRDNADAQILKQKHRAVQICVTKLKKSITTQR